jgi:uncharacterized protein DUF2851
LKEVEYQKLVRNYLSSIPLTSFTTKSGKSIQIISPGIINVNEGPDFLDFAIMLNGKVIVGDAEFHINALDWENHKHFQDKNYDNVILHLVLNDNSNLTHPDILILDKNDLANSKIDKKEDDKSSYEEIQHFALLRLLRKSTIAQKNINQNGQKKGILITVKEFLIGYMSKKRRPVYNQKGIIEFLTEFDKSRAYSFLESIIDGVSIDIYNKLEDIVNHRIYNEGKGLRVEILINCILPLSLCLSDTKNRVKLLEWYWASKSINTYGLLSRRFPDLSQDYVWQQQGMLEYLRDHGNKKNITAEEIQDYGINQILDFYSYGKIE